VPTLDSKVDDLYKGPLQEFVASRTALAKTLSGDEAKRVKGLQKPTVVPWAVNQLYWHARPAYDRLVSSGEKLREAQIEALKGRSADVRRATEAHRKALADAVTHALRLASAAGAHPGADELTRTLETISLARDHEEQPGRLTKALRPAGFEALAGVPVKALPPEAAPRPAQGPRLVAKPKSTPLEEPRKREAEPSKKAAEPSRKAAEPSRKAERQRKKAIERATAVAARAKADESRARAAWERSKQALAAAELALASLTQEDRT